MNKSETLATMGFRIEATFVPFSQSRSANDKNKSLNWRITLYYHDKKVLENINYMQGIGHAPSWKWPENAYIRAAAALEAETGYIAKRGASDHPYKTARKIPPPKIAGVLYSLILDSNVLNHDSFESWASEYGFDSDSIKALDIYSTCLKYALKMRSIIPENVLAEISTLLEDY